MDNTFFPASTDNRSPGHVNHHTVVHVAAHLPRMMQDALESCFTEGHERTPEAISAALGSCVTALDVAMLEDFRTRFPIQEQAVTDESIRERLQEDRDVIFRCFGGCTVLACVSDAVKKDIWVVNLGGVSSRDTNFINFLVL